MDGVPVSVAAGGETDRRGARMRLAVAVSASAAVVLASPFVGAIRGAIQSAFPGSYRTLVLTVVLAAVTGAFFVAAARIRERRTSRYGLLVAAALVGLSYAQATRSGNAEVDAVEYFHFVEYGLLTLLYDRVWRHRRDLTRVAMPLLAGLLVATFDEALQWFVPFRVGELRDLLLNGVALVCGLLFALALWPPGRVSLSMDTASRVALARMMLVTVAAAAIFFHVVHLGHQVAVAPASTFMSRFSEGELAALANDRAVRWGGVPPVERRLSREDHYLSEGRWHIQERNEAVTAGDIRTAWHEERILEIFFAPVLAAYPGDRWPAEQRADAERRAGGGPAAFTSQAHAHPIYAWTPAAFWVVVGAALAALGSAARRTAPRQRQDERA